MLLLFASKDGPKLSSIFQFLECIEIAHVLHNEDFRVLASRISDICATEPSRHTKLLSHLSITVKLR